MKATIEGYTFNFPTATSIIQLDDPQYHSSSAMKAVDVVAELPNHRIFVEIKNYEEHKEWFEKDPCNDPKNRLSKIRFDIIYKYRDSFLYYWCSKAPEKENIYVFLTDWSDVATLQHFRQTTDARFPVNFRQSKYPSAWVRTFVNGYFVVNKSLWNQGKLSKLGTIL